MAAVQTITDIIFGEDKDEEQLTSLESSIEEYFKLMLKECDYDVDRALKRTESLAIRTLIAFYKAGHEIEAKYKLNPELSLEELAEYNKILNDISKNLYQLQTEEGKAHLAELKQKLQLDLANLKIALREGFEELLVEMQADNALAKPRPPV